MQTQNGATHKPSLGSGVYLNAQSGTVIQRIKDNPNCDNDEHLLLWVRRGPFIGHPVGVFAQFEFACLRQRQWLARDRRVTTEEKIMTHSAIQETIEFARRMGPVRQLDIEKHLDSDCKGVARNGLLKGIVLHVKRVHFSKQNAPSLLLLLVELAITLFVAGVVVPNLLRPGVDAREALVRGSLHSIRIAGIALSFTYENLGCALLGMLTGAAAALLIAYPATTPDSENSRSTF